MTPGRPDQRSGLQFFSGALSQELCDVEIYEISMMKNN
jgi:hypothetical protein